MGKILDKVNMPEDVRKLDPKESKELAKEIRSFLVEKVSRTGGHLSANLGVVELTIALHQCFDFSKDKLVFDVGHQAYVHKILTGRKDRFDTLRQYQGLSGFPSKDESPYDLFDTGHATTSISSAYGLAKARDLKQEDYHVVCVIGDGSLTGGLAYEAMNNAGKDKTPFIVVLNDNKMSINQNVGSLSAHLGRLRTRKGYLSSKRRFKQFFAKHPLLTPLYRLMDRAKDRIKYLMVNGILFEEMGFTYLGPVDGHDIEAVKEVLEQAKSVGRPALVHVLTEKGKGYVPAETHPDQFHGVGKFDPRTGLPLCGEQETYADVFGSTVKDMMAQDQNVVVVTAAMQDGCLGSVEIDSERLFDVGIAEEHAVTFAAGLARGGMKPFVAIYSSFLQRAYDQIVHDVCLQGLPVIFALDHSGIVGEDGKTHQGVFDISYLSHIPGLTVMAPSCKEELIAMLKAAYTWNRPAAIRYPKGAAGSDPSRDGTNIVFGKSLIVKKADQKAKNKVAILALGTLFAEAEKAAMQLEKEGIGVTLVDVRFVHPLDEEMLAFAYREHDLVVTLEENVHTGGFGAMTEAMAKEKGWKAGSLNLSVPDIFPPQDSRSHALQIYGLEQSTICQKINHYFKGESQ